MPSQRRHRGLHPEDQRLFDASQWPRLRSAVHDLSWLWSRRYAQPSSIKLVGDCYQLTTRQRTAVGRSSCTDNALTNRQSTLKPASAIKGADLAIDGFNLLTTLEVVFSNGVILRGRDACLRDMASMHGKYRMIAETLPAVALALHCLQAWQPQSVLFLLDQPVSNSGRLAAAIHNTIGGLSLPHDHWQVEVVPDPDSNLKKSRRLIATADSGILDAGNPWVNLASEIVNWGVSNRTFPHPPWLVDLSDSFEFQR